MSSNETSNEECAAAVDFVCLLHACVHKRQIMSDNSVTVELV